MLVRSSVRLACRLVVASVGLIAAVCDLRRVVDNVADRCMMEDRFDHCSSKILYAAKDMKIGVL